LIQVKEIYELGPGHYFFLMFPRWASGLEKTHQVSEGSGNALQWNAIECFFLC